MLPFMPALIGIALNLYPLVFHPRLRHFAPRWPSAQHMTPAYVPVALAARAQPAHPQLVQMGSALAVVCYSDTLCYRDSFGDSDTI